MEAAYRLLSILLLIVTNNPVVVSDYNTLLVLLGIETIRVPPDPSISSLQIPIDVGIDINSRNEQCVDSNGPYCYSYRIDEDPSPWCSDDSSEMFCFETECVSTTDQVLLSQQNTDFTFVSPITLEAEHPGSLPECGLQLEPNALYFNQPEDQSACNQSLMQPSLVVNVSKSENATLTFTVESNGGPPAMFLSISALSLSQEVSFSTAFSVEADIITNNTAEAQAKPISYTYNQLQLGAISLVLVENGYAIFSQGEIAMTVNIPLDMKILQLVIGFGSIEFQGSITKITMYNSAATTNEVYSMYVDKPIAMNTPVSDCMCPPGYMDSFGLMQASLGRPLQHDGCYDGFSNERFENGVRYNYDYKGKWAIFTPLGWRSDFTEVAEIIIKMPQPMLIYSIGGYFQGVNTPSKRPTAIEVRILAADQSKERAIIYVSHDCEQDFGIKATEYPQLLVFLRTQPQRKRRSMADITPRCYQMDDIVPPYENFTSQSSSYSNSAFEIPILDVNDASYQLSDAFLGDISIKLIGHEDSGLKTNWFIVSNLFLLTRPHCGGHPYTVFGPPKTIAEYYEFHKPDARGYTCDCPEGITGDMCESCGTVPGTYRYMKEPDVCADCDCSDLTLTGKEQCDPNTGQCECSGNANVALAGRQCHWYISEIGPLYGPIAGGTHVVMRGRYLTDFNISFTINILTNGAQGLSKELFSSGKTLTLDMPSNDEAGTVADFLVFSTSSLNIGPPAKFFKYVYKSNPILEKIQPRSTILSGGKNLTITGQYMDSVAAPQMVVYVRDARKTRERLYTACYVISGTEMHCPTANITEEATALLGPSSDLADQNALNGINDIEFTLGFVFDGHIIYEDLFTSDNETLNGMATLSIYQDPLIETFESSVGDDILYYHPVRDYFILITGERLDLGVSVKDYTIEMGDGVCKIDELTSTEIWCVPPMEQPEINHQSPDYQDYPLLKLKVGSIEVDVGYVSYITNIWLDNVAFRISMIVLIVLVCLAVIGLVVFLLIKRCRRNRVPTVIPVPQEDKSVRYSKEPGNEASVKLWFKEHRMDPNIQANVDRCKIPQERLTLGIRLGKGNFGYVYKGQLITPSGMLKSVAVKSLKDDKEISFEEMESFLAEGTMMINFKHKNVMSLIGVVFERGDRPLVVLPYMENGDLCNFLKRENVVLDLADILHFGYQIANGMAYLAKERFVHRDLAARNCMVDGSYIVKIADFGMSRDVYEKDYYKMDSMNKPLPMKWMAIESLTEGRYSSRSDVWSYGVTLWELLTHGSSPYPGVNNYCIKDYVSTGKRLDKPKTCPPIVYEMMCKCWEEEPESRPLFDDIAEFIEKLLGENTAPDEESDEASGYYYVRNATRDIPEDYLDTNTDIGDDDDYIDALLSPTE